MECLIPENNEEKTEHDAPPQVQVVSQKDIHDFWEHVSTEDRIGDVCATFLSESKQVVDKLYASSSSVSEKFAVANFLLQVGALQFRVQKNPENEDELQTIIILQKPDDAPSKEEEEKGNIETDVNHSEQAANDSGEDDDNPWKQDDIHGNGVEKEELLPPLKSLQCLECSHCSASFTSLWERDLHQLSHSTTPNKGEGSPATGAGLSENSSETLPSPRRSRRHKSSDRRKQGRPRKLVSGPTRLPHVVGEPRKRGRPRKVRVENLEIESKRKPEKRLPVKLPLGATRSMRIRRLPLKFRDIYPEMTLKDSKAPVTQEKAELTGREAEAGESLTNVLQDVGNEESEMGQYREEDDKSGDGIQDKDGRKPLMSNECDICGKRYKSAKYAEKHKLMGHSDKQFKCSTCGKDFRFKAMFKRHLIGHKNEATNTTFVCSVCNLMFFEKHSLSSHLKTHNKVKCDFCDKTFTHISMMQRHRNNIHTKEYTFPCTLCEKVFYLKNRLKDHMVTHSGKKEHKCEICGMEFFLLNRLRMHRKVVHVEGKPFLCDLCGSGFKSKSTLKQHHLTTHTDIKKFPCRQCGKLFSRTSLRNQHERVHSGLNPHPCEHCGKGFRDKFKLQVHVNWHLGIHPYSCEECQKTFLVKGNLTKHMRIHTGERPYVCGECGRGCIDSSQLKKHMAQQHNIHIGRRLTKGPERKDGELPSKPKRRAKALAKAQETGENQTNNSVDSQVGNAYTIATDALIEFSQRLAHMSNHVERRQFVEGQQQASEVVATTVAPRVPTTETPGSVLPVMIDVTQGNQVSVPVTQSISDFQSLELISL